MVTVFGILVVSMLAGMTFSAASPTNVVEIYFVVDRRVMDRYVAEQTSGSASAKETQAEASLRADIDYLVTEMNTMYSSLQAKGLSIGLAIRKIDILSQNLFNDREDVDPALKTFDSWLETQGSYASLNYDAAILWTGHELLDKGDSGVAGYAHVGEVCKDKHSSGIAEFDMTYNLALTTAHELGHILGAGHDSQATGFVMIPTSNAGEANRWDFSLCTKEAFDAVIGKLSENCMTSQHSASSVPSASVTDALGNPDTICRRSEDNQASYLCRSSFFYNNQPPKGDAVCKKIYCKQVGTSYCNSAFTSDGLICGTNKRCNEGSCVDSPDSDSGAVTDESCIYGDQPSVSYSTSSGPYTGDCAGFVQLIGKSVCDTASVATSCCKTCGDLDTGIPGCKYGDSYGSCNDYTQAQICDNYADICCEFCHGYRKKRGTGGSGGQVHLNPPSTNVKVEDDLKKKPEEKKEEEAPPEAMA